MIVYITTAEEDFDDDLLQDTMDLLAQWFLKYKIYISDMIKFVVDYATALLP